MQMRFLRRNVRMLDKIKAMFSRSKDIYENERLFWTCQYFREYQDNMHSFLFSLQSIINNKRKIMKRNKRKIGNTRNTKKNTN